MTHTNTFIGNVGQDAQVRFTPAGKPVANFTMAEGHGYFDQQQQWVDQGTTWRRVSVWGKDAEAVAEKVRKGDKVVVIGREQLKTDEGKDGRTYTNLEVNAQTVAVVVRAPQQQGGGGFSGGQRGGGFGGQQAGGQSDPWTQQTGGTGANDWSANSMDEPPF